MIILRLIQKFLRVFPLLQLYFNLCFKQTNKSLKKKLVNQVLEKKPLKNSNRPYKAWNPFYCFQTVVLKGDLWLRLRSSLELKGKHSHG